MTIHLCAVAASAVGATAYNPIITHVGVCKSNIDIPIISETAEMFSRLNQNFTRKFNGCYALIPGTNVINGAYTKVKIKLDMVQSAKNCKEKELTTICGLVPLEPKVVAQFATHEAAVAIAKEKTDKMNAIYAQNSPLAIAEKNSAARLRVLMLELKARYRLTPEEVQVFQAKFADDFNAKKEALTNELGHAPTGAESMQIITLATRHVVANAEAKIVAYLTELEKEEN